MHTSVFRWRCRADHIRNCGFRRDGKKRIAGYLVLAKMWSIRKTVYFVGSTSRGSVRKSKERSEKKQRRIRNSQSAGVTFQALSVDEGVAGLG